MRFRRLSRSYKDYEIAPEEVLLDDANSPDFNRFRLEGRLERPLSKSAFLWLHGVIAVIFAVLTLQVWSLQVQKGEAYAAISAENSIESRVLFAKRGPIFDRRGVPLVENEPTEEGFFLRRYRTEGTSSLLGYVSYPKKDRSGNYYDVETKGLAGVESSFQKQLSGKNGRILVEMNALGEVQSQGAIEEPEDGGVITLSIDVRVQEAFYRAIKELADRIPYSGGTGMLMDVETGELIAFVSYPEYDSNVISFGAEQEVIASYAKDKRHPYLHRAFQGLFAPGSVVKPLEAAGALTDGIIDPAYTIVDTKGYISIPNRYNPDQPTIFRDWRVQGSVDLRKAIAVSSDIYFYMLGGGYGGQKGLGIERLAYWYRAFGLEEKTGIELSGEEVGFIPTPAWKEKTYGEPWTIGNTYHTAVGQYAMQVTPLAIARALAALANGGTLVEPTILSRVQSNTEKEQRRVPVNESALAVAHEGMRQGVISGTSAGLFTYDSLVHIAGKTGTAQLGAKNEYHNSWATGFFPYEHPKYVYVVLMDKGPADNTIGGVYIMSQVIRELSKTAPEYFAVSP